MFFTLISQSVAKDISYATEENPRLGLGVRVIFLIDMYEECTYSVKIFTCITETLSMLLCIM